MNDQSHIDRVYRAWRAWEKDGVPPEFVARNNEINTLKAAANATGLNSHERRVRERAWRRKVIDLGIDLGKEPDGSPYKY
jgi:hypothetical protein